MTVPVLDGRMARMLSAVAAERSNVIPFPPRDYIPATLEDAPSHAATRPEHAVHCPPQDRPRSEAGSGRSSSVAPHVSPFQRRQPDVSVLIEAPRVVPLDPAKREALEWAERHRDGWDAVGIAVAIGGMAMILSRCLPSIFPSLFY